MSTSDFDKMAELERQMAGGQEPENARPRLVSHTEGLVASGIGKSFNKKRVVRNVSMQLRRGEAVGLLGPNGAGKTTTFHILVGLLPADEGNVQLDGTDITGLPVFQRARLGLGYLPRIEHFPRPYGGTEHPCRAGDDRRHQERPRRHS